MKVYFLALRSIPSLECHSAPHLRDVGGIPKADLRMPGLALSGPQLLLQVPLL